MSDKKGKITLAGLTKSGNSSSNAFMSSFRFSPESENIEEIKAPIENRNAEQSSTPPSPKPNSGDVSPLKEYLLKEKHKWTNKWDKKSLSLDLDLKGKFKTALEDKTKSILSNFIPEETGVIHTSQSIPENLTRVYSSFLTSPSDDNSSSSGSAKGTKNNDSNGSQETLDGDISSDIFKTALGDDSHMYVEEIGVDMTDPNNFEFGLTDGETIIDRMITFNIPGEDLQEYFDGQPTLYQPIALISGIRITPLDLVGEESELLAQRSQVPSVVQFTPRTIRPRDVRLSTVIINILSSVVYHPLTKYWVALLAANFLLPLGPLAPFMWFLLGGLTVIVMIRGLSDPPQEENYENNLTSTQVQQQQQQQQTRNNAGTSLTLYNPIGVPQYNRELKFPTKSQGWMTQLLENYNPETCHFKMTKVVFVKLDGPRLYLQYPNAKHRIPKRRLWNDPVLTSLHTFDKVKAYNLTNAKITIVPEGLSRNRVWNKKYPICITLANHSISSDYTPSEGQSMEDFQKRDTTVNYNAGTADVIVNSDRPKSTEKEIKRQDASFETVYLFARCDREKDDWFRRFVAATKIGTEASYYLPAPPDPISEYRDYMRRICPSLIPHNISDGFDNVSLPGDISESRKPNNEKNSPSSSKKTTPEKDLHNSQGASIQSDLENILTVPQSPQFLNALLGRLFFDFLKSSHWKGEVQKLIDKKLFYMKKPVFIEGIHVKELTLGNSIPVILRASPPVIDHQGLWIDLDLNYESNFCVSLETHVNFLKMVTKRGTATTEPETVPAPPAATTTTTNRTSAESGNANSRNSRKSDGPPFVYNNGAGSSGGSIGIAAGGSARDSSSPTTDRADRTSIRSHIYDSDADDSGESSEDEHDSELNNLITINPNPEDPTGQSKSSKFLEKLANSSLMNRGLVKKIVNNVAATPLVLAVELKGFFGTLTVNLPGPPNDRVWLGFRTNPDLQLVAKPLKFGDTHINISQVTTWIKAKILLEFQRAVVCPNMVDVTIPLMEFGIPR